ncbi:MAG: hypothetical protein FJ308_17720 [Planctomycetes bacterium]|nr:hypothetical protein [Planctomycetota bacterium]
MATVSTIVLWIVVLCGASVPKGHRVIEEQVDMIELNHFYDPLGRHVYDQVIFYHVSPETGKFRVRAWCLIEDRESLSRRPLRDATTSNVHVEWYDDNQKLLRRLSSKLFRESWTQVDPERSDKVQLEEKLRLSLADCPSKALPLHSGDSQNLGEAMSNGTLADQHRDLSASEAKPSVVLAIGLQR